MILTALYACDNVEWGGMSVELRQPDPPPGALLDTVPNEPEEVLPPLPEGPVLSVVERTDGAARLVSVAEVAGDSVLALLAESDAPGFTDRFVQERLAPGSRFAVFADGQRVGTFTLDGGSERDAVYCAQNIVSDGYLELHPSAIDRSRFLALPEAVAADVSRGVVTEIPSNRGQRINALRIYGELLNQFRARWPDDTQAARADLRIVGLGTAGAPALVTTFLFRDRLSVAEPGAAAHSIFFLAELEGPAYQPKYIWYRRAADEGKGAPRFLDHVDVDGDGSDEFVMDVLGTSQRWFAVVNRTDSGWELAFQDACGQAAPSPSD